MGLWLRACFVLISTVAVACGQGQSKKSQSGQAETSKAGKAGSQNKSKDKAMAAGKASQPGQESHHDDHGDALQVPFAECPLTGEGAGEASSLIDQASKSYSAARYPEAYECASAAAASVPRSVDAHHLRAAAAAAMGKYEVARTAFTMALALDPDDPETLAATADFYINVLPPKRRETLLIGLEHARRGRARAVVRRRTGRELRARLALLESQAYNDLGQPDEALERVDEVLDLMPDWVEAEHERGVALFNLCRFEEAEKAFAKVLAKSPDDAYAHHHMGLIYERLRRFEDSERHFARARALAPEEFWAPVLVPPEEFRAEVKEALGELPAEVTILLDEVAVEVADVPALSDLMAVDPPFSPTILGLFRGLPLGVEAADVADSVKEPIPPRAIVFYRKNLARAVKSRAELDQQIRRTLLHEIGHLSGLDEDALRRRGLD